MRSRRTRSRRAPGHRVRAGAAAAFAPSAILPEQVQPPGAETDEQGANDVPARAPAMPGGGHQQPEAQHDDRGCEDHRYAPVQRAGHSADSFEAATMTRHGACFSTKSTVSPKIARLPAARRTRRGPPITMISEPRRVASSTMARPALRARTMRSTTRTP